jgi:hypothetical protein
MYPAPGAGRKEGPGRTKENQEIETLKLKILNEAIINLLDM